MVLFCHATRSSGADGFMPSDLLRHFCKYTVVPVARKLWQESFVEMPTATALRRIIW
jgi:hypothetical protein